MSVLRRHFDILFGIRHDRHWLVPRPRPSRQSSVASKLSCPGVGLLQSPWQRLAASEPTKARAIRRSARPCHAGPPALTVSLDLAARRGRSALPGRRQHAFKQCPHLQTAAHRRGRRPTPIETERAPNPCHRLCAPSLPAETTPTSPWDTWRNIAVYRLDIARAGDDHDPSTRRHLHDASRVQWRSGFPATITKLFLYPGRPIRSPLPGGDDDGDDSFTIDTSYQTKNSARASRT